eukprot:scaffold35469_cov94-Isochrysis_galbana.AAC.3
MLLARPAAGEPLGARTGKVPEVSTRRRRGGACRAGCGNRPSRRIMWPGRRAGCRRRRGPRGGGGRGCCAPG